MNTLSFFTNCPQLAELNNVSEAEKYAQSNEYLCCVKSFTNESNAAEAMKKLRSMKSYSLPLANPLVGSLARIIDITPKEHLHMKSHVLGMMVESACKDYMANMEFLLGKGLDVNCKLRADHTALHYAISEGSLETVKFLLDHGADVNNLANGGMTTVHIAAMVGRMEILKILLDSGVDVNAKDASGMTALHHAAIGIRLTGDEKLHLPVIKLLLEKGLDVNDKDSRGQTPLLFATRRKAIGIVDLLLKNGAITEIFSKQKLTPLFDAVSEGATEIVKLLLASGANPLIDGPEGINVLSVAILESDEELVTLLLDNGADVNVEGRNGLTPLHFAIRKGPKNIIELLLKRGANASLQDEAGDNALHEAILQPTKNEEIIRILLDSGVDFNARNNNGYTPLHLAVKARNKSIVEILLDRGVDVDKTLENDTDYKGCTALSLAAYHGGQEEIAKMLLNKGANIQVRDRVRATPLFFAVTQGYPGMVKMLLDNGARVYEEEVDDGPNVLAQHAVRLGHKEIVELLLQHGAEINGLQKDARGREHRLINFAAMGGQAEMMEFLLERGAIIVWDALATLIISTHAGFEDCAKIVVRELIIIQALYSGYKIDEDILDHIGKFDYLKKFMKECESELKEMEKSFPDTSISYISVLQKSINDLAFVAANENVLRAVTSEDFVKVKFPLYGSKVVKRVLRGVDRKKLLDSVARFFNCLYDGQDEKLPSIMPNCTKKIFENLNNKDLKNLAEAFESSVKI